MQTAAFVYDAIKKDALSLHADKNCLAHLEQAGDDFLHACIMQSEA